MKQVETLGDLLAKRDQIAVDHWHDKESFNREDVWTLLEIIARLEEQLAYVKDVNEALESAQEHTLAGALRKMRGKA